MTQKVKNSAFETVVNVGSGACISFALNATILPSFVTNLHEQILFVSFLLTCMYTSVSMIRSFIFRRVFNKLT